MIRRTLATLCCLAAVGCSAAGPEPTQPATVETSTAAEVPADGVLLSTLGYRHAPADFSVPASSIISDRVDQDNTVVAVFTAPSGQDMASYLRTTVPQQGWSITADANDSLLFERGEAHGAFTVTEDLAAVSIRWDARS